MGWCVWKMQVHDLTAFTAFSALAAEAHPFCCTPAMSSQMSLRCVRPTIMKTMRRGPRRRHRCNGPVPVSRALTALPLQRRGAAWRVRFTGVQTADAHTVMMKYAFGTMNTWAYSYQ